jgi:hypothetical protein
MDISSNRAWYLAGSDSRRNNVQPIYSFHQSFHSSFLFAFLAGQSIQIGHIFCYVRRRGEQSPGSICILVHVPSYHTLLGLHQARFMSGCGQCFHRLCCLELCHRYHHPMPTYLVIAATSNAATPKDRRDTGPDGRRVVSSQSLLRFPLPHTSWGLGFWSG